MTGGTNTALITGATSGLGQALARRLLDEGWRVISIDRHAAADNGIIHIACDLADRAALDRAMTGILAAGPFDLVVLNAGLSATGSFEVIPGEAYVNLMRVNAEAPMVLAATLIGAKAIARGGSLVFVSSLSHFTGYPGAAVYAATKDAIAIFAKSIRKACARDGVAVCVAFPGPLRTDHAARHAPDGADAAKRMAPDAAAAAILGGVRKGHSMIVPGAANRAVALAGRLVPGALTRIMRRIVFEKLGEPRW